MLGIAFELIREATSNSLLMFCFCNLIIVMIFTGSSKPSLKKSKEDSTFITSMTFGDDYDDEEITVADVSSSQDESLINDSNVSQEENIHCFSDDDDQEDDDDGNKEADLEEEEEEDDEDGNKEADLEEEEEEDDLRMRVEEFIAKINNEWRHEKLRALNLVH